MNYKFQSVYLSGNWLTSTGSQKLKLFVARCIRAEGRSACSESAKMQAIDHS